jgi:hypothetical protein
MGRLLDFPSSTGKAVASNGKFDTAYSLARIKFPKGRFACCKHPAGRRGSGAQAWIDSIQSGRRGITMHTATQPVTRHKVPAPLEPVEIRTLILKLRWIGRDNEAERLLDALSHLATIECPEIGPYYTG